MHNELHLILGCFGCNEDTFISCPSVENRILLIDESLVHYNDIMDYLDNCKLFDKPFFDYNGIRNILFNIRERFEQPTRRIWSEKKFHLLERFTIEHKKCGLYLKLILVPEIANIATKNLNEEILIIADDVKSHSLKLVKNR